jgi:Mycolic acid cyclopropane synthetase
MKYNNNKRAYVTESKIKISGTVTVQQLIIIGQRETSYTTSFLGTLLESTSYSYIIISDRVVEGSKMSHHKSAFVLPSIISYDTVRPHHCLALYGAYLGLTSILERTKITETISKWLLNVTSKFSDHFLPLIHAGLVPDVLIRYGIRLRLRNHLLLLKSDTCEEELEQKQAIVQELTRMPIAIATDLANEQHYEVPAAFYDLCLGPCKKYSSGLWPTPRTTFEESELAMLACYCHRAGVQDGMRIVDLGCGWGSLTLYLLETFPNCHVTSISNSHSQREYIVATAQKRGLNVQNLTIVTVRVAFLLRLLASVCIYS